MTTEVQERPAETESEQEVICAIIGCPFFGVDERGPIHLRVGGEAVQVRVCTEHWEAILGPIGAAESAGEGSPA